MRRAALPASIRVEAKFTTSRAIVVPRRELDALTGSSAGAAGLVGVLFWSGDRRLDGRWILVDAAEGFRRGDGDGVSLTAAHLVRLEGSQPWLAPVRAHVAEAWKPFLAAFLEPALAGHEPLKATLDELHRENRLAAHFPADDVLDLEHRRHIGALVETLGEHVAGHVFQDLLAYLLALAGYRSVQVNPVGVPDIEVSDLAVPRPAPAGTAGEERIRLDLTPQEHARLVELARAAGDTALLERLRA